MIYEKWSWDWYMMRYVVCVCASECLPTSQFEVMIYKIVLNNNKFINRLKMSFKIVDFGSNAVLPV